MENAKFTGYKVYDDQVEIHTTTYKEDVSLVK